MTLNKAVNFFGWLMGNFLDVRMTSLTLYLCVNTVIKDRLVDIKEFKSPFSINDADTRILVSQEAVADICSVGSCKHDTGENNDWESDRKEGLISLC